MNTPPLLPETRFKPLSTSKLESMIDHAVTHHQLPRQAEVIAFHRPWAFATGMTAMAASIMLAFLFTPQYSTLTPTAATGDSALTADVSDLLLYDSLGA